ncbi:MAG: 8-amino-7-oxononanoate synthase [Planctomycetes bacterium]|nr:8-amino-7-oxononanoate synthase [Planctomycetota bacterium]
MSTLRHDLEKALASIRSRGLERRMVLPEGTDFSSNDYLGLARDPEFRETILDRVSRGSDLSAPASRLLRGHREEHERLERRLAAFKGAEAALLFPSGYQANIGLLTALAGPRDRVIFDQLCHASIIDALRLSGARKRVFPHLDARALEEELDRRHDGGHTIVVTESLFSMDGDIAPLDVYADLARHRGAALIVDDAHATGVYGEQRGSGLLERLAVEARVDAAVTTFGKALGLSGACATGQRIVIDALIQRARPFIFTTAMPPLLVAAVDAALDLVAERPERRSRVIALADRLRSRLRDGGLDCLRSEGPIVPVIAGANERAVQISGALRRRGFDVRAIRPPSVPRGTARLRISVHADHREDEIDALADAIAEEFRAG